MIGRAVILPLIAYLFAGSESRQRAQIDGQTIGILGKLTLLGSSLLGQAATLEDVGKFVLMDIDASCIPSNVAGIVRPGNQPKAGKLTPQSSRLSALDVQLEDIWRQSQDIDFSCHIEPDWEFDTQRCLVVYRSGGRLVHRVNPLLIDCALLECSSHVRKTITDAQQSPARPIVVLEQVKIPEQQNPTVASACHLVTLDQFHGGNIVCNHVSSNTLPEQPATFFIVPTCRLPKAKACIASMYYSLFRDPIFNPFDPNPVGKLCRLPDCIENLPDALIVDFRANDACAVLL